MHCDSSYSGISRADERSQNILASIFEEGKYAEAESSRSASACSAPGILTRSTPSRTLGELRIDQARYAEADHGAHLCYNIVHLRTIGAVYRQEAVARGFSHSVLRIRRIVAILIVFDD
jgi:hypothetical protein